MYLQQLNPTALIILKHGVYLVFLIEQQVLKVEKVRCVCLLQNLSEDGLQLFLLCLGALYVNL